MASEIPEDIQKAAAKLLLDTRFAHDEAHHLRLLSQALLAERQATNQRWKDLDETARESGLLLDPLDVAEAVMTERERCRLIAAGFDDGSDSGFSLAARTIERIIRQDSPNAPTT